MKAICAATAVARSTIGRGLAELRGGKDHLGGRVRRAGGGRKAAMDRQTGLLEALSELSSPSESAAVCVCWGGHVGTG